MKLNTSTFHTLITFKVNVCCYKSKFNLITSPQLGFRFRPQSGSESLRSSPPVGIKVSFNFLYVERIIGVAFTLTLKINDIYIKKIIKHLNTHMTYQTPVKNFWENSKCPSPLILTRMHLRSDKSNVWIAVFFTSWRFLSSSSLARLINFSSGIFLFDL
jgi:hypothetical protein